MSIFARKITVLHKNGYRTDYTHITKLEILETNSGKYLMINGETDDVANGRCNVFDKLPISDLHMTIIDWYVPK